MKRPFIVMAESENSCDTLTWRVEFRRPLSSLEEIGWREVMNTFFDLASTGAMAGAEIRPDVFAGSFREELLSGNSGVWHIEQARLDADAMTPLLNLVHWAHLNISTIDRIQICWSKVKGSVDSASAGFPEVYSGISYELRRYDLVGQDVGISIDFLTPQSVQGIQSVNDYLWKWFKAANWGAYATGGISPNLGGISLIPALMDEDPLQVTWFLKSIPCSEYVFDGLVNCLERISLCLTPIRSVIIGE